MKRFEFVDPAGIHGAYRTTAKCASG